jgi:hypothetical protein
VVVRGYTPPGDITYTKLLLKRSFMIDSLPFDTFNWSDEIKKDKMCEACSTHGKDYKRNILAGEPQVKILLGDHLVRREDNNETHLHEVGCAGIDGFNGFGIGARSEFLSTW